MTTPKKPNNEASENIKREKLKLPFWVLGIGFIFPPAWPFLIIGLAMSYPKSTAVVAGTLALTIGGSIFISSEQEKTAERDKNLQAQREQSMLPDCQSKYSSSSNVPTSDSECLLILTKSENEIAQRNAQAESSAISSAEFACRRAVKESLTTTDGYHIPLGSVNTARYAGHEGQFITKFPFSVKNAFGVTMKHGVECVATGEGNVIEVNQLF